MMNPYNSYGPSYNSATSYTSGTFDPYQNSDPSAAFAAALQPYGAPGLCAGLGATYLSPSAAAAALDEVRTVFITGAAWLGRRSCCWLWLPLAVGADAAFCSGVTTLG
jgi:hypothetical protein